MADWHPLLEELLLELALMACEASTPAKTWIQIWSVPKPAHKNRQQKERTPQVASGKRLL